MPDIIILRFHDGVKFFPPRKRREGRSTFTWAFTHLTRQILLSGKLPLSLCGGERVERTSAEGTRESRKCFGDLGIQL